MDDEEMAQEEVRRAQEEYEQTVAQWQEWEEKHGK
jgi:hypothetical protein